jgi:hypothetical protein
MFEGSLNAGESNRPFGVTILAWLVIGGAWLNVLGVILLFVPRTGSLLAAWLHASVARLAFESVLAAAVCAVIGINLLQGANWARWTYLVCYPVAAAYSVLAYGSVRSMALLLGYYSAAVAILLSSEAVRFFTGEGPPPQTESLPAPTAPRAVAPGTGPGQPLPPEEVPARPREARTLETPTFVSHSEMSLERMLFGRVPSASSAERLCQVIGLAMVGVAVNWLAQAVLGPSLREEAALLGIRLSYDDPTLVFQLIRAAVWVALALGIGMKQWSWAFLLVLPVAGLDGLLEILRWDLNRPVKSVTIVTAAAVVGLWAACRGVSATRVLHPRLGSFLVFFGEAIVLALGAVLALRLDRWRAASYDWWFFPVFIAFGAVAWFGAHRSDRSRLGITVPLAFILVLIMIRLTVPSPLKPLVRAANAVRPGMTRADVTAIVNRELPYKGVLWPPDIKSSYLELHVTAGAAPSSMVYLSADFGWNDQVCRVFVEHREWTFKCNRALR